MKSTTHSEYLEQIIAAHQRLQTQNPLIHYISNSVAAHYVANLLLAIGASPALIDNPFEAADFTQISAALNINLGTPTVDQVTAMHRAAAAAKQHQVPWVLDPVGYGAILKWRSSVADALLNDQPTVIRGNASEIFALAGGSAQGKGVDSTIDSSSIYPSAKALLKHSACIAISGASDFILSRDEQAVFQINGGSAFQPRMTATGCALGAVIAAYLAVSTPTIACLAAHIHFSIAGQFAEQRSQGMGSFAVAFMDGLSTITSQDFSDYADFQILQEHM